MPSHLPAEVRRLLDPIRLLILDVDGVLTDGTLIYSSRGEEAKRFCVSDGLAIRILLQAGVEVAILSGRASESVVVRCRELGVKPQLVVQGSRDKKADLEAILESLQLEAGQAAAMGDDLPDLPMLRQVAFAACPADAAPEVVASCHHVCGASGGHGAVRETAELILKAQRRWIEAVRKWTMSDGDDAGGPA